MSDRYNREYEREYDREVEEPRPRSRRSRRRAKKRKKMIILVVVEVIVLLLIAGGAFAVFYVQNLWDKVETVSFEKHEVQTNEDLPETVIESSKGYTTIMFYGVDARNNTDLVKNANSDSDIICCINNDTKEVKLVSVLRDTFVQTTDGKWHKLTDVYAMYGVQEAIETINRNFDLNISEYVTVNWRAVAETIDLLGGLDIEISSAEASAINQFLDETIRATGIQGDYVDVYEGEHHLTGIQCTSYARVRNVGHHDIDRASRQRTVIMKMLEAAKSAGIGTLNDICNEVFPNISTNFSLTEVLGLAADVASYDIVEQTLFPFDYVDQQGGHYYVYCNTLVDNVTALHKLLYDNDAYSPSATVQGISDYITEYRYENP